MWFDPDLEVPMLCSLSSVSEDQDSHYEGGALERIGTTREEEGVTRKGSEAKDPGYHQDDLPF